MCVGWAALLLSKEWQGCCCRVIHNLVGLTSIGDCKTARHHACKPLPCAACVEMGCGRCRAPSCKASSSGALAVATRGPGTPHQPRLTCGGCQ